MKRPRIIRAAACILAAAFFFCAASCGDPVAPKASQPDPAQHTHTRAAETKIFASAEDAAFPDEKTSVYETQVQEVITSALPSVTALATEPAATTVSIHTTAPVTTTTPAPLTSPVLTTRPASTAHIHSYHTVTSDPTCTERGYVLKTCECGDKQYTYTADALGHDFGDFAVTKEATYTGTGEKTRVCTRCGLQETETIPMIRPYESTDAAQEMLRLINEDRAKVGSAPLSFNYTCYPCAQIRAQEIITNYSHTRPSGKPFYSVVDEMGLDRSGGCAENLYNPPGNNVPPADGHAAFMNSKAHRTSLLNPLYKSVSICVLYTEDHTYFVELFFG